MKPKLVLATGISGAGGKEFLARSVNHCAEHKKNVKVYDVAKLMRKFAEEIGEEWPEDNILNTDPRWRATLRAAVLKYDVLPEIADSKDLDAAIICLHDSFYWNKCFQKAYDKFLSSKRFKPDMYFTFIDDFRKIKDRLDERSQWQGQNLTYAEILSWQNTEVINAQDRARNADKPFFAIPTSEKQSISTLYKLLFCPEIDPIYIAMPISHFREEAKRAVINAFIKKLDKYFTVFNPLAVEIVGAASVDDFQSVERTTINEHVKNRDLYWFVPQVKKLIAYWPGPIPSPGMSSEIREAFTLGKDVWQIYLGKEASPFITSMHTGPKLFETEDEFFEFLERKYPERKNLVW